MKSYVRIMIAICHILSTELCYVYSPGEEIETVCSERAENKLALGSIHLFMWLLSKCLLMMSMKQLGIGTLVISLENIGWKIFGHNCSQLNRCEESPGDFHLITQ